MTDCYREKVLAAKRRVIDELAQFRTDNSDTRLATLKVAIDNWHNMVGAWSQANTVKPTKRNLN
jgi:hypothetical protein